MKLNILIFIALILFPSLRLLNAQPNYLNAIEAMKQNLPSKALDEINKAIFSDAKNDQYLAYRGFILRNLERYDEAFVDIENAIKMNQKEGWYFIEAIMIAHRLGYIDFAKIYSIQALKFSKLTLGKEKYDYVLNILDELQDYEYELVIKFDPKNSSLVYEPNGLLKIIAPSSGYPYQKSKYSLSGAIVAKKEFLHDTEYLYLKPNSNSVTIRMKVSKSAYSYIPQFKKINDNKKLPKPISEYLRDSPRMNLQSNTLRTLADQLKGKNDLITISNTIKWVNENMEKMDNPPVWNRIDDLLSERKIECGTGSFTVTALLRSNGIPARQVWGPIDNKIPLGYLKGHVWTEVYLGGLGWVPVEQFDIRTLGQLPISYIRMATDLDDLYGNRPLANMMAIMNNEKYGDIISYTRRKLK